MKELKNEEVQEVTQEAEYVITETTDSDGNATRLVSLADGTALMDLPTSFTDEQIDVMYNLCGHFFSRGQEVGVYKMQADLAAIRETESKILGTYVAPEGEEEDEDEEPKAA